MSSRISSRPTRRRTVDAIPALHGAPERPDRLRVEEYPLVVQSTENERMQHQDQFDGVDETWLAPQVPASDGYDQISIVVGIENLLEWSSDFTVPPAGGRRRPPR